MSAERKKINRAHRVIAQLMGGKELSRADQEFMYRCRNESSEAAVAERWAKAAGDVYDDVQSLPEHYQTFNHALMSKSSALIEEWGAKLVNEWEGRCK